MPPQTKRRHQQGEESRLRILAAAFEIASERGYDGTTLALVTKRAGLPASSVYWQFKDKDDLLAAAIEHNYREWREARTTWTDVVDAADVDSQVETAMRNLATGLLSQPQFQRLGIMLALERRAVEATARARFRKVRDETITMMTGWWHRVLPDEALVRHPQAPRELAQLMIAMSDGLLISTQTDESLDIDRMINLLIIAMRAVTHSYSEQPPKRIAAKRAPAKVATTKTTARSASDKTAPTGRRTAR